MNSQELQTELETLLNLNPQEIQAWESAEFDTQVTSPNMPLVLFGAGGLGRRTLRGLQQLGITPLCFTDNNPMLHNRTVDEIKVLPPREAIQRFGKSAAFVVTIWGGRSPDRMADRLNFLTNSGCSCVLSFYSLFCKYPQMFLPHYACDLPHLVNEDRSAVLSVGKLWSDSSSRQEYLAQLKWRARMDFSFFPDPVKHEIYFPEDICPLRSDETFVDCGAFDGDTVRSFLEVSKGRFEKIVSFEPDPQNFKQLTAWLDTQPATISDKVDIEQSAVSDVEGTVRFSADGTEASAVGASGSLEVKAVTIDNYFSETSLTYLKMDIEGAELSAIKGAANVIQRDRPVLAICVYHEQNHIWKIPELLNSICDNYRFYLRPHLLEGWDTVLYAIPAERGN